MIAFNASFTNDIKIRRSFYRYIISLFKGLITWKTARQNTMTTLIIEAELKRVKSVVKETIALKRLFKEI